MSKLAALAAKRRQKESERSGSTATGSSESQDDYAARLNKLRITDPNRAKPDASKRTDTSVEEGSIAGHESADPEHLKQQHPSELSSDLETAATPDPSAFVEPCVRARPSPFASIMTSQTTDLLLSTSPDLLVVEESAKSFDFTEPSPDDVVTRAQNAKGRH